MPVHYARAKKRWRFDFNRILGGRRFRSTKLLPAGWSRSQAEAYDRAECAHLYALATGIDKPALTLAHAVALYLDHRVPQLRDRKNIARELAQLYDHILTTPLDRVGDMAREYTATSAASFAAGTIRNRLAYLRAAVRYAYRVHAYGDQNYADRITMPTVNNERQVFLRTRMKKLPQRFETARRARCSRWPTTPAIDGSRKCCHARRPTCASWTAINGCSLA
jgi:hypothetical protein